MYRYYIDANRSEMIYRNNKAWIAYSKARACVSPHGPISSGIISKGGGLPNSGYVVLVVF